MTAARHWAERLVRCHLEAAGMEFLAANYSARRGEIDLVMRDGGQVVFVEVRQRQSDSHGSAAESLVPAKLARIRRTARLFLLDRFGREDVDCRVDAVLLSGPRHSFRLSHLKGVG